MKIRAIIVEDEEPARILISRFLSEFQNIEILGEFEDGFKGVKAINELKPDLVILDIQMPRLTGFEVMELAEHKPLVVFSTAYDQYAIKAFEINAVDYLLKPYNKERFSSAITKAIEKIKSGSSSSVIEKIEKISEEKNELLNRIAVKSGSKINVIPAEEIRYLEAEGDYVMIHTREGKHLKEKTMKYFESHLDPQVFIRIHRSFIVNIKEISRLENYDKENHVAILKSNDKLKVSASGYKLLKEALKI